MVFSANYEVGLPGQPFVRPWMFVTGADRPPVDLAFARTLGAAWKARVDALRGPSVLLMGDGTTAVADALLGENLRPIT